MAIVSDGFTEYNDSVKFDAVLSPSECCMCNGCHRCARVIKIKQPWTSYHNGERLRTKYTEYWLCASCLDQLLSVIDRECGGKYNVCADGERSDAGD